MRIRSELLFEGFGILILGISSGKKGVEGSCRKKKTVLVMLRSHDRQSSHDKRKTDSIDSRNIGFGNYELLVTRHHPSP